MYVANWTAEKGWDQGSFVPYGPVQMYPSAQVCGDLRAWFGTVNAKPDIYVPVQARWRCFEAV